MGPEGIGYRPAGPGDAEAAVPLVYSSGPAAFDYVFDCGQAGGAQAFLAHAFRAGGGEFGWRNHEVAVVDDRVVAVGSAFDGRSVPGFTLAGALQIFSFFGPLRAWAVIVRGLRTESIIRPPPGSELYLCHLGVREDLRGQGIGRRLVEHLLGRLEPGRHRAATLDVAVTNPRAQALYERLGFTIEALRASTLARRRGRVVDHRRMRRGLPGAGPES